MVVAPHLVSLHAIGVDNSMWEVPYICFFIIVLSPSWNQTIWFCLLCAIFVFSVMCVACHLRMRMVARAFRERWTERTRVARELQDTILQTVQGSKLVADEALERSNDADHMRLTMERLSTWLGQATQEGQAALNALSISTTETSDQKSKSKRVRRNHSS
jgi:hypothetical protein